MAKTKPRGAPKGNQNRVTHGLKMLLVSGKLPKGSFYIQTVCLKLRRHLEAEIEAREGELSTYHVAVIQSVSRHESRYLLIQKWLTTQQEKLSVDQRLALLKEMGSATQARDRALRELGLHKRASDLLRDKLYTLPVDDVEHDDPHDEPADESSENLETNVDAKEGVVP